MSEKPLVFRLSGLTCADCAKQFERSVAALRGVTRAEVNCGAGKLRVWGRVAPTTVLRVASQAGYGAAPVDGADAASPPVGVSPRLWFTLFSGLLLAVAAASVRFPEHLPIHPPWREILLATAVAAGGAYPFRSAYHALRRGRLEMNVLMSVATLGAVIVGAWFEGVAVIFLFSLGEWLQSLSLERARRSVSALLALTPEQATLLRDGAEVQVLTSDVRPGDICVVKPGERVPVDGCVIEGESAVDEAQLTGEPAPVGKRPGDPVYAGSFNEQEILHIEARRPAAESLLARIVERVEEAQGKKVPAERFIERFARIYTPSVMCLALLVAAVPPFFFGESFGPWIYRGLVLLVLSCPCALGISVPAAVVSALGQAARSGVLIKSGACLEALASVDVVAFDKTGTLTKGSPVVHDAVAFGEWTREDVLAVAAAVERGSNHPVGQAIIDAAVEAHLAIPAADEFAAHPGNGASARVQGVRYLVGNLRFLKWEGVRVDLAKAQAEEMQGEGISVVGLAVEGRVVGLIALGDAVREEAERALRRLKQMGGIERYVLLTGDTERAAGHVAARLALDEVRAELLSADKAKVIKDWQRKGARVAMVADGMSDAPALASADVGIALGAVGSEIALQTADIALMSYNIAKLPYVLTLARRTVRVMRQNTVFAVGVKVVALAILAAGELTLWMAMLSVTGASLLVTWNGLRLLRRVRVPAGRDGAQRQAPLQLGLHTGSGADIIAREEG